LKAPTRSSFIKARAPVLNEALDGPGCRRNQVAEQTQDMFQASRATVIDASADRRRMKKLLTAIALSWIVFFGPEPATPQYQLGTFATYFECSIVAYKWAQQGYNAYCKEVN
jgi:hypothetical protein